MPLNANILQASIAEAVEVLRKKQIADSKNPNAAKLRGDFEGM